MITEQGLREQLLANTVARERPDLQEKKEQLIVESAKNRDALYTIESKILEVGMKSWIFCSNFQSICCFILFMIEISGVLKIFLLRKRLIIINNYYHTNRDDTFIIALCLLWTDISTYLCLLKYFAILTGTV